MNQFATGSYVWWVSTTFQSNYIEITVENVLVLEPTQDGSYRVKTEHKACYTIPSNELYPVKKDALNVAVRRLQEKLFNE